METTTLSTKFQLVIPAAARRRLKLKPGMKFTVVDKGGVIFLIPERGIRSYRGLASGVSTKDLREKKDRT